MAEEVKFICEAVEPPIHRYKMNGAQIEAKSKEPEPKHPTSPPSRTPGREQPVSPPPEEEPDEPVGEPTEPEKERVAQTLSMSEDQFQQLITELRKPVVDENKIRRQKRDRDRNRHIMGDNRKMLVNRFFSCNHMQLPGSVMTGCSAIAWATQSDGKRRGICQHCGTIFSSERSECASQEIWEAYRMLVRIPTHPAGNINHVFQSS